MKTKISLKRISVATITGSIAMLVLVPWIVGAQPSAVPTGGNVDASFNTVTVGHGATTPALGGSFRGTINGIFAEATAPVGTGAQFGGNSVGVLGNALSAAGIGVRGNGIGATGYGIVGTNSHVSGTAGLFENHNQSKRLILAGPNEALRVVVTAGGAATLGANNNVASGLYSVAMGSNSSATNNNAVAMGNSSSAEGDSSIAAGYQTNSGGSGSVALGYQTSAGGSGSTSLGYQTNAAAMGSTALGWLSSAPQRYATAMGYGTTASGLFSTALGRSTSASGDNSTAMGWHTTASGWNSTATGNNTTAIGTSSTAMGESTVADGYISTAMGESTNASGHISTAMGSGTNASSDYSTAMGRSTTASGSQSTAMGRFTIASGSASTAMGSWTNASGEYSTAIGSGTTASGNYSTAMGNNTTASGQYSTALGLWSEATGYASTAIGSSARAQAYQSTAIGLVNAGGGNPNSYVVTDPLFEIGNGISWANPNTAFKVNKDGNIDIVAGDPENAITKSNFRIHKPATLWGANVENFRLLALDNTSAGNCTHPITGATNVACPVVIGSNNAFTSMMTGTLFSAGQYIGSPAFRSPGMEIYTEGGGIKILDTAGGGITIDTVSGGLTVYSDSDGGIDLNSATGGISNKRTGNHPVRINDPDGLTVSGPITATGKIRAPAIGSYTTRPVQNLAPDTSAVAYCNAGEIAVFCGGNSSAGLKTLRHGRSGFTPPFTYHHDRCYAADNDSSASITAFALCFNPNV